MTDVLSALIKLLSASAIALQALPAQLPAPSKPAEEVIQSMNDRITVDGSTYKLSFSDEFDGDTLDLTKWSKCPEWQRQGYNCWWKDDCSYLNGKGQLVLESRYDDGKYFMGAVRSKDKFEQAYGYFEVRCTLNNIPGYWTAFWLMGETVGNVDGSGVDGTEIDIYESAFFKENKVNHGLNWDGYGAYHRADGYKGTGEHLYDGNYHTFSLLWTETEYVFYIDGKESWRTDADKAGGTCTAPLYLKLSAETGEWTAKELDPEKFPDSIMIDYVRVYTRE